MSASCRRSNNPRDEISALLEAYEWRQNLVGAVATLIVKDDQRPVDPLWNRIEMGSWAGPQLCAVACLIDPGFAARAKQLLRLLGGNETAAAARDVRGHAKTAAALMALTGDQLPKEVEAQASVDVDHGGIIAVRWKTDIVRVFEAENLSIS